MRLALLSILALTLAGCGRPALDRTGQSFTASGQLVAMSGGDSGATKACFLCHGLNGEGDGVAAPRLAGLPAGYLQKQLTDYAAGLRPDKVMAPIARKLDPAAIRAVAAHYAALPAPNAPEGQAPAPRAWNECASCHGAEGQGVGQAAPALAGQPRAYALDQLRRWREGRRRNDPQAVMTVVAEGLAPADALAIAAWLERRSASRPPDSAAATLSVAEASVARWAAWREERRRDR